MDEDAFYHLFPDAVAFEVRDGPVESRVNTSGLIDVDLTPRVMLSSFLVENGIRRIWTKSAL